MNAPCPTPLAIAAYLDEGLPEAEAASLLDHVSECDMCRRELALTSVAAAREATEDHELHERLRALVLRAVERQRLSRRMRTARIRVRRVSRVPLALTAAAAVLASMVSAVIYLRAGEDPQPRLAVRNEKPPASQTDSYRAIPKPPSKPAPPAPQDDPVEPEGDPEPQDDPAQIAKQPPQADAPAPQAMPAPPTTPEPPPSPPVRPTQTQPLVRHEYESVTLGDVTGDIAVRRPGTSGKEKLAAGTTVGEGDVLSAEKMASFYLQGAYAIAMVPHSEIVLAAVQGERMPALIVRRGEALVDSASFAGSRWLVGGGGVQLTLDSTRSQFAVESKDRNLALTALSGPVSGCDDGGRPFHLAAGERLTAQAGQWERQRDEAAAQQKAALLNQARPKERSLLQVPFDGSSMRSVKLVAGDILRERTPRGWNEHLRSTGEKEIVTASILFMQEIPSQQGLRIRFRLCTNLTAVRVGLAIEDKAALHKDVKIDRRRQLNTWITVELGLEEFQSDRPYVLIQDRLLRFAVSGRRVDEFGDMGGYILLDDVQIFEPQP
ncbi:MAG: hypothetical protein HY716_17640 [Planctomycetes bacterium]|nr:hypothetical protein [Planctomycetota bacterium]